MPGVIIIIINDIYRAQNSQGQQMRQVSCCMITVIEVTSDQYISQQELTLVVASLVKIRCFVGVVHIAVLVISSLL